MTPEQEARKKIDELLTAAGWLIQNRGEANTSAAQGVAIREFLMKPGYGEADYLLFVDGMAAGVIEAKKAGTTLTGFETQTAKYTEGLPAELEALAPRRPLPFCYQSTGVEARAFGNRASRRGTHHRAGRGPPGTMGKGAAADERGPRVIARFKPGEAKGWLDSFFGKWPGEETEEDFERALRELRG